jgi:hypothetical protein
MTEVTSVNGKTGAVVLKASDVEAVPGNIDTGKPGQRRLSLIKGGVNAWVDDNNGMPLKAFGAKWDGVTDDSKALEEAIEASVELGGQPILLPFGTGVINSEPKTPVWTSTQVAAGEMVQISIRGASMFGTVVKLPEALTFLQPKSTAASNSVGYVDLREFTVNGNNQVASSGKAPPVVWGTVNGVSRNNVNIEHVRAQRIRAVNVGYEDKERSERVGFALIQYQTAINQALNIAEHINLRELWVYGGGGAVSITASYSGGGGPKPINVRGRHIYVGDTVHVIPSVATEKESFSTHVIVGGSMWSDGVGVLVENCYGMNSGDNGFEFDVPGVIRNCTAINPNNVGFTFTTFNPATTREPIATLLQAEATAGVTSELAVESSAAFEVGRQILLCPAAGGASPSETEVRTIESKPNGTHIKLSKPVGLTWASGTWVQQVDDMGAVKLRGENLSTVRTAKTPGGASGLQVQNFQCPIPMWGVDIDGFHYENNVADAQDSLGTTSKAVVCQAGTSNSPTGNPYSLSIKGLRVNRASLTWAEAGTVEVNQMTLAMPAQVPDSYERANRLYFRCPVSIQGIVKVAGPGATGGGVIKGSILATSGAASGEGSSIDLDLDLLTQVEIAGRLGESFQHIRLNSSVNGDLSGRIRHRTLPSFMTTPETFKLRGIELNAPYTIASQEVATTLTAAAAVSATTWEVASTEGFAAGMVVVMDALASGSGSEKNAKVEVFVIKEVKESEKKLVVVSVGEKPGCTVEHAAGATVAMMRQLVIEDSDWTGLPASYGVGVAGDSANTVFNCVKVLSSMPPVPVGSERTLGGELTLLPPSGSNAQILFGTGGRPSMLSIFNLGPSAGPFPYYQLTIVPGTRTGGEGTLSFKWGGQTYETGKIKFNASGQEVFEALLGAKTGEGLTLPGGSFRLTSGAANKLTTGEIVITAAGQLTGAITGWSWGAGFTGGAAPTFVETGGTTFLNGVEWSPNGAATFYSMPLVTIAGVTSATFPISPGDMVRVKYACTAFATGKITEKGKILTTAANTFESGDAKLQVKASWLPAGTYIKAFKSATEVELSAEATSTQTAGVFEILRINGRVSPQRTT